MANWRYKIELNAVIAAMNDKYDLSNYEEDCPPEVKSRLATEVEKAWPLSPYAKQIREVKSIAELNRTLDRLFDKADKMLVWCGF